MPTDTPKASRTEGPETTGGDLTQGIRPADPARGAIGVDFNNGAGDVQARVPILRLGVDLPADLQHIRMGVELRVDAVQVFSRLNVGAEQQPATCGSQMMEIWRFERVHLCDG